MSIRTLARKWRVRPMLIYQVIYDLESQGKLYLERRGRRIQLTDEAVKVIEKELQRRGHSSKEVSLND